MVAAGAVGLAAGAAIGAAAAAPTYAYGTTFATLPGGCVYTAQGVATYYSCSGTWFAPYYGANGAYYRVVPPP